jgi:hypothetical protein
MEKHPKNSWKTRSEVVLIEKNILTVAILEAMEKSEECPLCYLWTKTEERCIKHVLTNEVVMDPEFREKVVGARGFCNRHAHLLIQATCESDVEDGLGYALYMKDVVKKVTEQLSALCTNLSNVSEFSKGRILFWKKSSIIALNSLIKHKTQRQQCPLCGHLWSMDQIHLHTLVQMLDNEDFRKEFNSSKWLCLPHFASAMRIICISKLKNPIYVAQALLGSETKHFQLIENFLSEFIRKQSWNCRSEPAGPEVNVNLLVANLLVGAKGLYTREINVQPIDF